MADLPQLPERVRRKLALLLDELIEKHGFTGEHLRWPATRRRKIPSQKPKPPADINSRTAHFLEVRSVQTEPVYADPDTIGVQETGLLAAERYGQFVDEHFSAWLGEHGRRSAVFAARLVELRAVVADEIAHLWKERGDWFERVCRPTLNAVFTPLFDEARRRAREIEIADLAPEHTPFEQIMARAHEVLERSSGAVQGIEKVPDEQSPRGLPTPEHLQPTNASARRRGYRKEVRSWIERESLGNVERAARRLGLSKSALKSIMSSKGKPRYSKETLERVLKEIGHEDEG